MGDVLAVSPCRLSWIFLVNLICSLPNNEEKTKVKEERGRHAEDECEEEMPDSLPSVEEQEQPEDKWFFIHCLDSPCQFMQWPQEIKRAVHGMDPALTNKSKRYTLYRRMFHCHFGTLGKGNHRPLPLCFE